MSRVEADMKALMAVGSEDDFVGYYPGNGYGFQF
jgi:hypothetical protein